MTGSTQSEEVAVEQCSMRTTGVTGGVWGMGGGGARGNRAGNNRLVGRERSIR